MTTASTDPSAITWATGECWLGCFLVAERAGVLCGIELAQTPEEALRSLASRHDPGLIGDKPSALRESLADVASVIARPGSEFTSPIDERGTLFQREVWAALREIPPGETRTYAEVAQAIGRPTAVRAVASACAANPVAIITPCHRVVRSGGGLGGYRWGVGLKRALLDREAGAAGS